MWLCSLGRRTGYPPAVLLRLCPIALSRYRAIALSRLRAWHFPPGNAGARPRAKSENLPRQADHLSTPADRHGAHDQQPTPRPRARGTEPGPGRRRPTASQGDHRHGLRICHGKQISGMGREPAKQPAKDQRRGRPPRPQNLPRQANKPGIGPTPGTGQRTGRQPGPAARGGATNR